MMIVRFSRYNFDGFCAGVLFTSRQFSELVLGSNSHHHNLDIMASSSADPLWRTSDHRAVKIDFLTGRLLMPGIVAPALSSVLDGTKLPIMNLREGWL